MMGIMEKIAVSTLQENTDEIVARAKAGEIITIVVDGQPAVQIGPAARDRYQEMVDAGRIIPAKESLRDLPPPLKIPGATLSDDIIRAREEERF